METLNPSSQAFQESTRDDVERYGHSGIMETSLGSKEARHSRRRGLSTSELPLGDLYSQRVVLSVVPPPKTQPRLRWRRERSFWALFIIIASLWVVPTSAVFLEFENCLSESYRKSDPTHLQFVPLFLNAVFNTTDPNHNLNVTVWGNVTGSGPNRFFTLPPANASYWSSNDTSVGGKIENVPEPDIPEPKLTTLFNKVNVLTYEPWNQDVDFCNELINASCPLGPAFNAPGYVPF